MTNKKESGTKAAPGVAFKASQPKTSPAESFDDGINAAIDFLTSKIPTDRKSPARVYLQGIMYCIDALKSARITPPSK